MTPPDLLRYALFATLLGMALLAVAFLRRRDLTPMQYLLWGLLVILVPILGPYMVIALKPGELRKPR